MKFRAIILVGLFLTVLGLSIATSAKAKAAPGSYHFPTIHFHSFHGHLFTLTASHSAHKTGHFNIH